MADLSFAQQLLVGVLLLIGAVTLINIIRENGAQLLNASIRGGTFIAIGLVILYIGPDIIQYIDRNFSGIYKVNRYLPRVLQIGGGFRPFEVLVVAGLAGGMVLMCIMMFVKAVSAIFKK